MKTYKYILGTFFLLAAFGLSILAIMVVLDISTVDQVMADGKKLLFLLGVLAAMSALTAVVTRSMSKL